MRFLDLFSGISAASRAWEPLGWQCAAFAEIDPSACKVLKHHYADIPNLGDVSKITDEQIGALGHIDIVVGGSPCQDLSVAGKRAGLAGARSSLFHEQLRIFHAAKSLCGARYLLWENVLGAFSSNAGSDFAVVVGAMAGLDLTVPAEGWGYEGVAVGSGGLVEWCVLDAQWFHLAQRRKRVFALLDSGNWPDRGPLLLERESLRGNRPSRKKAQENAAAGTLRCTDGGSDVDHARALHLVPVAFGGNNTSGSIDVATAVRAKGGTGHGDFDSETFVVGPLACNAGPNSHDAGNFSCNQGVDAGHIIAVAFDTTQITHPENRFNPQPGDPCHTLSDSGHPPAIALSNDPAKPISANEQRTYTNEGTTFQLRNVVGYAVAVRRLTARECERLQGFPDDYTRIPIRTYKRRKLTSTKTPDRWTENADGSWTLHLADGPRYKMIGNSMATTCMAWIGEQIQGVA